MSKKIAILQFTALAIMTLLVGCSSSSNKPLAKTELVLPEPNHATLAWRAKLDGFVGDLDLSEDENRILVSTVTDPQTAAGKFATILYTASGSVVWKVDHGKRVRAQSVASDGSVAAITDYDNRLKLFGPKGEVLFDVEAGCKPWVIGSAAQAQVFCFHDDDHTPGISVEVFDAKGERIFSDKNKQDLLAYAVSPSGGMAMAFDGGQLKVFKPGLQLAFDKKVDGEVLDLALIDRKEGLGIAALTWIPKKGQQVSIFSEAGKAIQKTMPMFHLQQLDWDVVSGAVVGFGNGTEGQSLVIWNDELKELWSRNVKRASDYLPKPVAAGGTLTAGVFDFNPGVSVGEIASYSLDPTTVGQILWNIPLVNEDQAYLFGSSHTRKPKLIAVAWDDGRIGAYKPL